MVAGEVGITTEVTAKCVQRCVWKIGFLEAVIWSYYWRTVDETMKSHSKEQNNTQTGRTPAVGREGLCHCLFYFCLNGRGRKGGFAAAKAQI